MILKLRSKNLCASLSFTIIIFKGGKKVIDALPTSNYIKKCSPKGSQVQNQHFISKLDPKMSKFIKEIDKNINSKNIPNDDNISIFAKKEQSKECQVCLGSYPRKELLNFSSGCHHYFCQGCLKEQIRIQIKNIKPVRCLHASCEQLLYQNSSLLTQLGISLDQREKYYKILISHSVSTQKNQRICPSQECQGYILTSKPPFRCVVCNTEFCQKCWMFKHTGLCDDNEADYLENNFNFRRCERCRYVVQKNEGCNHITCKCGHSFCYLCGQPYTSTHLCPPQELRVKIRNQKRELQVELILYRRIEQRAAAHRVHKPTWPILVYVLIGFPIDVVILIGYLSIILFLLIVFLIIFFPKAFFFDAFVHYPEVCRCCHSSTSCCNYPYLFIYLSYLLVIPYVFAGCCELYQEFENRYLARLDQFNSRHELIFCPFMASLFKA